jgi:hypothetical protein
MHQKEVHGKKDFVVAQAWWEKVLPPPVTVHTIHRLLLRSGSTTFTRSTPHHVRQTMADTTNTMTNQQQQEPSSSSSSSSSSPVVVGVVNETVPPTAAVVVVAATVSPGSATEEIPYEWPTNVAPPPPEVLHLWTEVGNGLEKSQTGKFILVIRPAEKN